MIHTCRTFVVLRSHLTIFSDAEAHVVAQRQIEYRYRIIAAFGHCFS